MKTIISALHFDWADMGGCLRGAVGMGLQGVELSWHAQQQRPHCTAADLEELSRLRGSGLCLCTHIWEDLARLGSPRAQEVLRGYLRLCGRCGVEGIVIHGGSWDDRREGVARTRRILQDVLGEFEAAGVVLNLENHYAYGYHDCRELFSEAWEFREVLSLDSPSLRLCLDTGHGHMNHNLPGLIAELGPWLHHVHLADNLGVDDDHCMFRRGTVPWDETLDALRGVGFDGTFCIEFPARDDRGPFERCLAELRRRWSGPAVKCT